MSEADEMSDQQLDQKCLKCGKTLFKKVVLDEHGHMARDSDDKSKVELQSEVGDKFYRCPHCQAKNMVVSTTSAAGLPQLKITHFKP